MDISAKEKGRVVRSWTLSLGTELERGQPRAAQAS
jgi:hypothetical protein